MAKAKVLRTSRKHRDVAAASHSTARKGDAATLPPGQARLEAQRLFEKGHQLQRKRKYREAVRCHLQGFRLDEENVYGLKLMADALANIGRRALAIEVYEQALALAPDDMEIHFGLGNLAMSLGMNDVAARFFSIYVQNRPNDAMGYNNLATVLREQNKLDEAIGLLQSAIPQFPALGDLWNTLATVVYNRDGLDAALPFYEEALRLSPRSVKTLSNLARSMEHIGDFERSMSLARQAIKADRRLAEPHMVLGHCLLANGHLAEGWKEYEHRLDPNRPDTIRYTHGRPRWAGEDLAGKHILVCPEQGLGDEILFANCYRELIAQAGHVSIGCDIRLIPLFRRSFPEATVGGYADRRSDGIRHRILPFAEVEDAEPADLAIECGSLFQHFRPTAESFPAEAGYLTPDPKRVAFWKARLDALGPGPKVGICWRSGVRTLDRNRYYTALEQWAPIFAVPGAHFVNLQYDDCAAELAKAKNEVGVDIHVWDDIDLRNDIDDIAALTKALDLVMAPATAPAMIAVAVGTELWSLLRIRHFWAFGGEDATPLHPKSRFFKWPEGGQWPEVIAAVASALEARTRST